MKKLLLIVFVTGSILPVLAQVKKSSLPAKGNTHMKAYEQAMQCGDANMASIALNYYIAEQGYNTVYADTLAMLYLQQGAYMPAYYWANKRLEIKKDDAALLEIKGMSLDKMGRPREAIELFEKLFTTTNNPFHAYKLMELQYSIKRLAECLATAQRAEKLPYKPEYMVTYAAGEYTGRTYLQAGVYNIYGLVLYDLDKKAEAKNYFEKALALDSTFQLAKQNLETLQALSLLPGKGLPVTTGAQSSPAKLEN
ncbi:MAG TPA: tetratricopeptide repeat protein [Ferruginibacter sp.]|nr:tetratricopeptide repeat protein [Ferruginibacter sp.]HMP20031.1 tetratricopeptide repeat protein [Ferruginibacter sp.]